MIDGNSGATRSHGGRWALAGFAALAVMMLAGCGSKASPDGEATEASEAQPKIAARGASVDPQHPVVEIDTSRGKIRVRLDAVKAPGTVHNFLDYVNDGFYSGTLIHHVDADRMILGGGYSADGELKPTGTSIRNEAHNGLKNVRGTIAMARDAAAGIDTATSQFFINLCDSPKFDHRGDDAEEYGYCVFGEVVDGLNVADEISRSKTQDRGGDLAQTPMPPVVVQSIEVVE